MDNFFVHLLHEKKRVLYHLTYSDVKTEVKKKRKKKSITDTPKKQSLCKQNLLKFTEMFAEVNSLAELNIRLFL